MTSVALVLVLSLSDSTLEARSQLLKTLSASLDPARVALKPRVLGNTAPEILELIAKQQPVVEVRWPTATQATIRAALTQQKWLTRVLTFKAGDPLPEQAKAIAFTIAAMMPEWRPLQPLPEPEVVPEVTALSDSDILVSPPPAQQPVSPEGRVSAEPAPAPFQGFVAVAAVGTVSALTAGGGLELGFCPAEFLCVGAAGTVLAGRLPDIDAHRIDGRAEAFVDLRSTPWWSSRLGFTARLAGGALYLSVTRGAQSQSRWTGTGGLELGPLLRLKAFELALTFGAHVIGETKIYVDQTEAGEIEPFFGSARLAAGWRF